MSGDAELLERIRDLVNRDRRYRPEAYDFVRHALDHAARLLWTPDLLHYLFTGNPANEASIRELAEMLVAKFEKHPLRDQFPPFAGFREVESGTYYGSGYQDVQHRRPSIRNAKRLLDWEPSVDLEKSVEDTLDFFLREALESEGLGAGETSPGYVS